MSAIPEHLRAEVEKWRNIPRERPEQIETPRPGQESVWDYPRPPRIESVSRNIRIEFADIVITETTNAFRVFEMAGPPVYYIPRNDIQMKFLEPGDGTALCEWKGVSQYWSVRVGKRMTRNAAWSYPEPWDGFEIITGAIAFNASLMNACYLDLHRVIPQPGKYYGGWITPDIVGPFKGAPGSELW